MAKYVIPSCGSTYDHFFKHIVKYIGYLCFGPAPEWTHIPKAEQTALADAYEDWYTGYSRTLKPHTKADTEAMKEAYARSKTVLSRFIQVWLQGFPNIVTAEHRWNMNISSIDDTSIPIPKPEN
jgi:hypothetical protein